MVSCCLSHAIWYSNFCALFLVLLSRTTLCWNTVYFFLLSYSTIFHRLLLFICLFAALMRQRCRCCRCRCRHRHHRCMAKLLFYRIMYMALLDSLVYWFQYEQTFPIPVKTHRQRMVNKNWEYVGELTSVHITCWSSQFQTRDRVNTKRTKK